MTREDIGQAVEIERASFSEPWTADIFGATLLLPYAYYYVAELAEPAQEVLEQDSKLMDRHRGDGELHPEVSKKIVAQCGIRNIFGEGEITNVAVVPAFRGQGISSILFEEALRDARIRGVREFTLEVRAGNIPAIALYEKFGFITEGKRKNFYEKPVEDALIMWLRERPMEKK